MFLLPVFSERLSMSDLKGHGFNGFYLDFDGFFERPQRGVRAEPRMEERRSKFHACASRLRSKYTSEIRENPSNPPNPRFAKSLCEYKEKADARINSHRLCIFNQKGTKKKLCALAALRSITIAV